MKFQIFLPAICWNLSHSFKLPILMIFKEKYILRYMQHLYRLFFVFFTEGTKLYGGISRLLSSVKIFESRYVYDKQIISNLWIELYTLRRTSFAKLCAAMLLRFQWWIDNFFTTFCVGPRLSSTLPHSKSKLHLNHRW